jgi:hypothetical protein
MRFSWLIMIAVEVPGKFKDHPKKIIQKALVIFKKNRKGAGLAPTGHNPCLNIRYFLRNHSKLKFYLRIIMSKLP